VTWDANNNTTDAHYAHVIFKFIQEVQAALSHSLEKHNLHKKDINYSRL